jgi:hypothetical protein
MRTLLLLMLLFGIIAVGNGQHPDEPDDTITSINLIEALKRGTYSLHGRNYFMTTYNQGALPNYYANGIGAGMHYQSMSWKGFRFGFGGFFIFNLFSNNLEKRDSPSGGKNRYEVALFDIENPNNRSDLDRLEEIYLSYKHKKISAMIGRFELNTPYINPQDSRMRPTVEEGIWLGYNLKNNLTINTGWLWSMSPRSTVKFFTVANSIGIYAQGVSTNGTNSEYFEHQKTKGIGLFQVKYSPRNHIDLMLFNQYVDNIFNTTMLQAEYHPEKPISPVFGVQYHFQHRINQGGNSNQELAYYENQKLAQVFSFRTGMKYKNHLLTLNYTHITDDGRFLSPREWGQEPFYTYMPKERNEGAGGVNAANIRLTSLWHKKRLSTSVAYGIYSMPDVHNYRLNKYGLPSYHHLAFDIQYKFDNDLKGLSMQLRVASKLKAGDTYENSKYVFNRVNMANVSFIINYIISNNNAQKNDNLLKR